MCDHRGLQIKKVLAFEKGEEDVANRYCGLAMIVEKCSKNCASKEDFRAPTQGGAIPEDAPSHTFWDAASRAGTGHPERIPAAVSSHVMKLQSLNPSSAMSGLA